MYKQNKGTRVQVNLTDDILEKVDRLAKLYGVTRSSLCAMYIGQAATSATLVLDKVNDIDISSMLYKKEG